MKKKIKGGIQTRNLQIISVGRFSNRSPPPVLTLFLAKVLFPDSSQELLKPNFGEKSAKKSTSNREVGNAHFYAGNFKQVRDSHSRLTDLGSKLTYVRLSSQSNNVYFL